MGSFSLRYVNDLLAAGANKDAKSSVGGGLCVMVMLNEWTRCTPSDSAHLHAGAADPQDYVAR